MAKTHTVQSLRAVQRLTLVIALCLVAAASFITAGYCVPACPGSANVQQPDGSQVTIVLKGDEHFHWNEDPAGYLVTKSPQTNQWVYAVENNGRVSATQHVVGREDPAALGLPRPDIRAMAATAAARVQAQAQNAAQPQTIHSGTLKNLVVLVNFSDLAVAYTRQQYDDLFNQLNYTTDGAVGSVRDFYNEVSYNTLTVQSTVVEPVTLDNGYAYYGGNDSGGDDLHPREMVSEALAKLEARGFDFRTVDGDGDGWIDGLTIIHAGGGEEYSGNNSNYIWSHQWNLSNVVTYDGVKMQRYHTEPARRGFDSSSSSQGITRIGVICHETGHFLGLPDFYDYGYDSEGAGDFCLMAGGSWGGSYGNRPVHPSAYCKSYLGWVSTVSVVGGTTYSAPQVETNQRIYKLQGSCSSNEYFLIENRQGVGFDQSLPGTSRGLLIWHVDTNKSNNDDQTHYMVDLEEASCTQHLETNDNQGNDSDYFRSNTLSSFTSVTCPNSNCYSGTASGLYIQNIGATGPSISFDVTGTVCTPPSVSRHPAGATICPGNTITMSIECYGSPTLAYQWRKNGSNISGATGTSYTTSAGVAGDVATYDCVVTNSCGTITSNPATVTVNAVPTISAQPADQSGIMGGTATFAISATGGALNYQWQVSSDGGTSFVNVTTGSGGSTDRYTTAALLSTDTGRKYRCVVSNSCFSTTSKAAALTVSVETQVFYEGFEQSFVSGAPTGWTREFVTGNVEWTRATGDHNGGTAEEGSYNALLYYSGSSEHTTYLITPALNLSAGGSATLRFWHKQAFWSPDQDNLTVFYKTSSTGTWTQLAAYTSDISSWTKETIALPQTNGTYYIGFLGNAKYGYGVCIDDVSVSQQTRNPEITVQPAAQTTCVTATATFSITATGPELHYQWQTQIAGSSWTNVGFDSSSLSYVCASSDDGRLFRCIVTNPCGSVTSETASLVVHPKTAVTKPADQWVCAGSTATLSVDGTGYGTLTYRWISQSASGGSWLTVGTNSSTYSLVASMADNGRKFRCVVTSGCGTVGSDYATLTVLSPISVSAAKLTADGQQVALASKAVTFADADFFYIEDDSRTCGIRVEKTAHGLQVGDRADVVGTILTTSSKERFIAAFDPKKTGVVSLAPVALRDSAVGGASWHYDDVTHAGQFGATGASGLNNTGLLIKTWGDYHQTSESTFTLGDGSGRTITCTVKPGTTLSSTWRFVTVTGISSLTTDGVSYTPIILVRDIQIVQ